MHLASVLCTQRKGGKDRRNNKKGENDIRINITNTDKVQGAIDAAQVRAKARTISADDVAEYVEKLEEFLSTRLYKKDWRGLIFEVDRHGDTFPGAYKGIPDSTWVTLERGPSSWFLTNVRRGQTAGPSQTVQCRNLDTKASELTVFAEHLLGKMF